MSDRTAAEQRTSERHDPPPPATQHDVGDVAAEKRRLRDEMRRLRRSLDDRPERSRALWVHVSALPEVARARRLMGFSHVPGEPETDELRARWIVDGREWAEAVAAAGADARVEPTWPDVVIVPGLAFTRRGERLGQGGGWYDRFLAAVRPDCVTVGVGFAEQVLRELPTEPHDVVLDHVVVDTGRVTS